MEPNRRIRPRLTTTSTSCKLEDEPPQEDPAESELSLLISTVLGHGDKEAQYLYEKCGDSILCLRRYFRFLQNEKESETRQSLGMQDGNVQSKTEADAPNYLSHEKHNLALLQFLQSQQGDAASHLKHTLEQWTEKTSTGDSSQDLYVCQHLLRKLQSLIAGYNLGILSLCQDQDPKNATILLASYFLSFERDLEQQEFIITSKEDPDWEEDEEKIEQTMLVIAIRNVMGQISFALLDSILTWVSAYKGYYQKQNESFTCSNHTLTTASLAHRVLTWLEGYMKGFTAMEEWGDSMQYGFIDSSSEFKFRLMCYKARLWFVLGSTTLKGDPYSDLDEVTRQARKELKNAMEIFHHKLESEGKVSGEWDQVIQDGTIRLIMESPSHEDGGGGDSVDSGVAMDLKKTSNIKQEAKHLSESNTDHETQQLLGLHSKYRMKKLQSQHQNALYLKAHLEFLKNNTKKSLKLCSEAINVNDRDGIETNGVDTDGTTTQNGILKLDFSDGLAAEQDAHQRRESYQESSFQKQKYEAAVYNNNLGLIHQASGKVHLALHYYAKALVELEIMEQVLNERKDGNLGFEPDLGVVNLLRLTTSQVLVNTAVCAQQARNFVTGYECMARCVIASQFLFYNRPRLWLHMAENCIGIHADLTKSGKVMESYQTEDVQNLIGKGSSMPVNEDASTVLLGNEDDVAFVKKYPLIRALFCLNTCVQLANHSATGASAIEEDISCVENARVILAYVWLELNNPIAALKETEAVIHEKGNRNSKMDRNRHLAAAHAYAQEAATLR